MSRQGPAWEQRIVKDMNEDGWTAKRIDKSGDSRAPADIQVGQPYIPVRGRGTIRPWLFLVWKRYLGNKAEGRRTTQTVVVMDYDQWRNLLAMAGLHSFYIEAKASQSESVTAVMAKARKKVEELG